MRKPISSVFEEKNVKYHKKVTMYPRLTIPPKENNYSFLKSKAKKSLNKENF